jgi:hypothetical protein
MQHNITQKEVFVNTGEFPSNCGLTGLVSIQKFKNPFDDAFFDDG